jgi:hypothetical protein
MFAERGRDIKSWNQQETFLRVEHLLKHMRHSLELLPPILDLKPIYFYLRYNFPRYLVFLSKANMIHMLKNMQCLYILNYVHLRHLLLFLFVNIEDYNPIFHKEEKLELYHEFMEENHLVSDLPAHLEEVKQNILWNDEDLRKFVAEPKNHNKYRLSLKKMEVGDFAYILSTFSEIAKVN